MVSALLAVLRLSSCVFDNGGATIAGDLLEARIGQIPEALPRE